MNLNEIKKKAIIRVLAITFVFNLAIALAKLLYGYHSHTLSMVADGFHSLMDSTSNIVGFVAISYAFAPPDEEHPYGHRKAEILASLFIGVLLGLTCLEIVKEVVFLGHRPDYARGLALFLCDYGSGHSDQSLGGPLRKQSRKKAQ